MDNKLTREEVLHVAHLARIGISEDEIEKYQLNLKQMIDEIDKIRDVDGYNKEEMISPFNGSVPLENRDNSIKADDLLKNVPNKQGNFVKVPVVINE